MYNNKTALILDRSRDATLCIDESHEIHIAKWMQQDKLSGVLLIRDSGMMGETIIVQNKG